MNQDPQASPYAAAALDQHAQEVWRLPAAVLMENAGAGLASAVAGACEEIGATRILYAIGQGNNGGDALVASRHLLSAGREQLIWTPMGPPHRALSPSLAAWDALQALLTDRYAPGLSFSDQPPGRVQNGKTLLVDALFGTGLDRPLAGAALSAVSWMVDAGLPCLAVDQPSCLDGSTGALLGPPLACRWTVTFAALKSGLLNGEGPALCGKITLLPIGFPIPVGSAWLRANHPAAP